MQETLHHATATMLVTSLTTAASMYSSIISDITAIKCFGLFGGTAIMMNFVLTLTLLPAVIVIQYKLTACCNCNNDNGASRCSKCWYPINLCLKPLKTFFKRYLPKLILKLRYIWILLLGGLGIGGALVVLKYPSLKLPSDSEFQLFGDDNLLEKWDQTYNDIFQSSGETGFRMNGHVLFGIKTTDTGDIWNPDDRGSLVLDDSFEFFTEDHQEWLLEFCTDLRNQSFFDDFSYNGCFIEPMIQFMEGPCDHPLQTQNQCCNNAISFPYDQSIFKTCFKLCASLGPCSFGVRFHNESDEFVAIYIHYFSSTPVSFDFNIMQDHWMATDGWMEKQLETAPEPLKKGWIISTGGGAQLYFYDLQNSLATGTLFALAITLIIAFVILGLTILNLVLAFYAILTVASAVFVTVACLVLLGWELNIFESIILILSVGLCVDFTLHYGVAYRVAPEIASRERRSEFSIETMTAAISVAALTTFMAGVFMFAANINAYYQLGLFLTLVMSVSWVYSTFFFQSLCRIAGPQNRCGDLTVLLCCSCKNNDISNSRQSQIDGHTNQAFENDHQFESTPM